MEMGEKRSFLYRQRYSNSRMPHQGEFAHLRRRLRRAESFRIYEHCDRDRTFLRPAVEEVVEEEIQ